MLRQATHTECAQPKLAEISTVGQPELYVNLLPPLQFYQYLTHTKCRQQWTENGDVILWLRDQNIIHYGIGHIVTPALYMTLNFHGVLVEALMDGDCRVICKFI